MQGTPDTLTVNASIEFVAPDVTGAMNQTSDRQRAVIDALVGSGIDRKDISTTQVSLQPQFAGGDSTAIIGYRASNSIDVKIRKLDTASQTLALIVSTGGDATRINSVNYSIEDDSQLVKDARARAFNDAKDRAQQYAQLSGLDLGKVISITESGGSTPPTPVPTRQGRRDGGRTSGARPADGRFLGDGDLRTGLTRCAELQVQPAGAMSTGMPLSTAVPDSGSSRPPSLSWLTLTPGWSAATPWRVPPRS